MPKRAGICTGDPIPIPSLPETYEEVPRVKHQAIVHIHTFVSTDWRNCRGVGARWQSGENVLPRGKSTTCILGRCRRATVHGRCKSAASRITSTRAVLILDSCSKTVRVIDSPRGLITRDGCPLILVPGQNGVDSGLLLSLSFHRIASPRR
jgi:hypothetical protein